MAMRCGPYDLVCQRLWKVTADGLLMACRTPEIHWKIWSMNLNEALSSRCFPPQVGCNTGHTAGDFVSHRTCHLSHRTCYRCGVHRYRFEPRVWLCHRGINIPRYTADTTVY